MISSMTGFSRHTEEADWGVVTWELRSVNHRYLELSLRLPEPFRELEKAVRDVLQSHLNRGKVEVSLRFQPGKQADFDVEINQGLAKKLAGAVDSVQGLFPGASLNMMDVLSWPGVVQIKDGGMVKVAESALTALGHTIKDLCAMREREGAGLRDFIEQRLALVEKEVAQIQAQLPAILEAQRQRMMSRFEELSVSLDSDRLEQEMAFLLQKSDIAEELQRLLAHVEEVRRTLRQGGVVGRRLDFLMQELNREANTLGSKSINPGVTQSVVELKVYIEQMREQVQNIE